MFEKNVNSFKKNRKFLGAIARVMFFQTSWPIWEDKTCPYFEKNVNYLKNREFLGTITELRFFKWPFSHSS